MHEWLQTASKITNEYSLAAYAIAALIAIVSAIKVQKFRHKPVLIAIIVIAILLMASLPTLGRIELARIPNQPYRISVSAVDQDGNVLVTPSIYTDVPSQKYQIAGAEQIEIDDAHVPSTRRVTVSADDATRTLHGSAEIYLSGDRTPSMRLVLKPKPTEIRGNVLFRQKGVSGARVSIEGYSDFAISDQSGFFVLPPRVSAGEIVYLLVQKQGFFPARQQHIAGKIVSVSLQISK